MLKQAALEPPARPWSARERQILRSAPTTLNFIKPAGNTGIRVSSKQAAGPWEEREPLKSAVSVFFRMNWSGWATPTATAP